MGMVIHDDFWQACQAMPEKQRAPFLYALVDYRFTKREPVGSPPWLPTFIALKQRIDMGDAASEKGRKMAEARWGKQDAQACPANDAQAHARANAQAYAQASNNPDAEDEVEVEGEINPYSPLDPSNAEGPFWLRCLGALNEVLGSTYSTMPDKSRRTLERHSDAYTVEEVGAMVAYKARDWEGTRYKRHLTPKTLFGPDHFEEYMHQAKADGEEAGDYAKYRL